MTADPRATRRATVRQLADQGMSARAIAAELRVSKDTVRRDLEAMARATETVAQPADAPPAPPAAPRPEVAGLFIPLTAPVAAALLTLERAGLTGAAAAEWALQLAADACRQAHTAGYPPGTPPVITAVEFATYRKANDA